MAEPPKRHEPGRPDLGQAHGTSPDRGRPTGHTPADHAEPRRPVRHPAGPDHTDPRERARPTDTGRGGA